MKRTIKSESRPEWLTERAKGIGSSEVAAILGVSPYQTPYELWEKKTRDNSGASEEDGTNLRFAIGHDLEERVAATFEAVTGNEIDKGTKGDFVVYDTETPYMRVSPDRYYTDKETGEKGILECKTTTRPIDPDSIPMQYFCQVQYQMGVTGLKKAALAWIDLISTGEGFGGFGYVRIDFDPDFFAFMSAKVKDFWTENVIKKTPPAPTTAKDAARVYPESKDKAAEVTDETAGYILKLKDTTAKIKELEAVADELKDHITTAFGDAERLAIGNDTWATYKTQHSQRLDTKKLKADHPDIYEEYCKESTTRVLRIK